MQPAHHVRNLMKITIGEGCLKRMKCRQGSEGRWETEPLGDPRDVPEGYQASPCEKCCTIVPDHLVDDCPHPESCNYGVWFAISRNEPYIGILRAARRGYLNGITEIEELCPICNWFMMRRVEGVEVYHHPEKCLRCCSIVLKEDGIQWEIRFGSIREPIPKNLCAGGRHTHESWAEYRKCYTQLPEKYAFHWELRALRGNKTHELCRKCADIFADHDSDQCQIGVEGEEPSLLKLWDDPTGNFVRFIGTMVQHAMELEQAPALFVQLKRINTTMPLVYVLPRSGWKGDN